MARGAGRAIGSASIRQQKKGPGLSSTPEAAHDSVSSFVARQARKSSTNRVLPLLVNAFLSDAGRVPRLSPAPFRTGFHRGRLRRDARLSRSTSSTCTLTNRGGQIVKFVVSCPFQKMTYDFNPWSRAQTTDAIAGRRTARLAERCGHTDANASFQNRDASDGASR